MKKPQDPSTKGDPVDQEHQEIKEGCEIERLEGEFGPLFRQDVLFKGKVWKITGKTDHITAKNRISWTSPNWKKWQWFILRRGAAETVAKKQELVLLYD